MSDELNVLQYDGPIPASELQAYAAKHHAQGYAQAVADVVEWINSGAGPYVEGYGEEIAAAITQRFGKDA